MRENYGKVGKVMREYHRGTLRSSSGDRVTDRKQAVAIGLSEERRASGRGHHTPGNGTGLDSGPIPSGNAMDYWK